MNCKFHGRQTLPSLTARLAVCGLVAAGLAGCGDETRRAIGLERTPPDEFQVITRAPLQIPPDFELRPPRPGAARPNEKNPQDQAKIAVFGASGKEEDVPSDFSPGETAILRQANALNAPDDIRAEINRETLQLADEKNTFVEELMFWRPTPVPEETLDPNAEKARLSGAAGKTQEANDKPSITRKSSGWFGAIF